MNIGVFILIMLFVAGGAFIVFFCSALEENNKAFKWSLIVLALSIFMMFYPIAKMGPYERPAEGPYVTHELMCLADANMMSGRIYLRSGYISEHHHYLYGYKTAAGGMKTQKVKADSTVVFFTDDVEPCAKWYEETQRFWFLTSKRYTCDIYVPTDSLVADYTIDLQ